MVQSSRYCQVTGADNTETEPEIDGIEDRQVDLERQPDHRDRQARQRISEQRCAIDLAVHGRRVASCVDRMRPFIGG